MSVQRTAVALALLATAACSEFQVATDYDRGIDFSALRNYAWTQPQQSMPIDPRVDRQFIQKNVQEVVDERLAAQGYRKVEVKQADFLVTYDAAIRYKVSAVDLGGAQGYGAGLGPADDVGYVASGGSGTVIEEFEEGKVSVLVLPQRGGAPLWRGSAKAAIDLSHPAEERAKRLRRAVRKIIERFPP